MKPLLLVALMCLGACTVEPVGLVVGTGDLPPIVPTYRASIVDWARGYYADPHLLRSTRISDPVPARDSKGRLVWLVCTEADTGEITGRGVQRQAFGFAPNYMSTPLGRRGATLTREDCDRHPLVWKPFPQMVTHK